MTEEIEELVLDLKKDSRFKILKDKNQVGFWASNGASYNEYTELESNNLKILYVKDISFGAKYSDEITVTNKKEKVYAFCNSPFKESIFKDKPIKKTDFKFDELRDYIDKNV
jgi:hypothetical protein